MVRFKTSVTLVIYINVKDLLQNFLVPITVSYSPVIILDQLEHHIKNVSKSTFGKLLKIVVLKHRVS